MKKIDFSEYDNFEKIGGGILGAIAISKKLLKAMLPPKNWLRSLTKFFSFMLQGVKNKTQCREKAE